MVLEFIGRKFTETELSRIVGFDPKRGLSPKMMQNFCELIDVNCQYHFDSSLEEIKDIIKRGNYPIVLVNPSILYDIPEEGYGHYVVVKDISENKVIINDPDQEYGGEDKGIEVEKFLKSWVNKHKLIFIIRGENDDQ